MGLGVLESEKRMAVMLLSLGSAHKVARVEINAAGT